MINSKINYFVDVLMIVAFIIIAFSSLVLYFILPSGQRLGSATFLSVTRHTYTEAHNLVGLILIALIILHLILHFSWFKAMTKKLLKPKNL